ncbi:MAG: superoxide dismutase family protein [Planctomycetota bacterium]
MRLLALTTAAMLLIACQQGAQQSPAGNNAAAFADVQYGVAVMHPIQGNSLSGVVEFHAESDGRLRIVAEIEGLQPDSEHGFHIHEYGDARAADATSAGGHYNPAGHEHGMPEQEQRHAGDLGNLQADADGKAHMEIMVDNASLHGEHPVLGRAVIIHAKKDDGGQPTGNAGARIGIGIIGIANPEAGTSE